MSPCCAGPYGHKSRQPDRYDPERGYDAPSPRVREPSPLALPFFVVLIYVLELRLDPIADNIARATFGVINAGRVRTADMGGTQFNLSLFSKAR
jgi:hypothetical protein